jgi:hypothetical protein
VKLFVDWVLSRRYRLVLVAVVFTLLLPVVASGLMVLNTQRRGNAEAAATAALTVAALALLAAAVDGATLQLWIGGLAIAFGVAIGAVLRWAGGLGLAFQATMLGSCAIVLVISLFGPEPAAIVEPVQRALIDALEAGNATSARLDAVRSWDAMLLLIVGFAVIFAHLVGALLLGYWWTVLASGQGSFGREFRALKLGRVLGLPAMALVSVGIVLDAAPIQNLSAIAVVGFLFQGLAVMHAWAHAKKWHPAFIWPVYLLLVTPAIGVSVFGLSAVGLLDNVFELRAGTRAQT